MNCTSIVCNWYVSNAVITLATVLATIPVLFSDGMHFLHGHFFRIAGTDVEICKIANHLI